MFETLNSARSSLSNASRQLQPVSIELKEAQKFKKLTVRKDLRKLKSLEERPLRNQQNERVERIMQKVADKGDRQETLIGDSLFSIKRQLCEVGLNVHSSASNISNLNRTITNNRSYLATTDREGEMQVEAKGKLSALFQLRQKQKEEAIWEGKTLDLLRSRAFESIQTYVKKNSEKVKSLALLKTRMESAITEENSLKMVAEKLATSRGRQLEEIREFRDEAEKCRGQLKAANRKLQLSQAMRIEGELHNEIKLLIEFQQEADSKVRSLKKILMANRVLGKLIDEKLNSTRMSNCGAEQLFRKVKFELQLADPHAMVDHYYEQGTDFLQYRKLLEQLDCEEKGLVERKAQLGRALQALEDEQSDLEKVGRRNISISEKAIELAEAKTLSLNVLLSRIEDYRKRFALLLQLEENSTAETVVRACQYCAARACR